MPGYIEASASFVSLEVRSTLVGNKRVVSNHGTLFNSRARDILNSLQGFAPFNRVSYRRQDTEACKSRSLPYYKHKSLISSGMEATMNTQTQKTGIAEKATRRTRIIRAVALCILLFASLLALPAFAFAAPQDSQLTPYPSKGLVLHEKNATTGSGIGNTVQAVCPGFIDEDADGICDYYGTNACTHYQRNGVGAGYGRGFVDADGDGVCDYYAEGTPRGTGAGRGVGFIDENSDGVCDYYGTRGQSAGQGRQSGHGHGNCRVR